MKQLLHRLRQRKPFRVFVRQLMTGSFTALIGYQAIITGYLPEQFAWIIPIVFALLNQVVKYINVKYFGDLGVEK